MPVRNSERPRIMQVMGTSGAHGGLERHFLDLCNALSDEYQVIAVSHPAYAKALSANVQFESLGTVIGRRNPFTLWRVASIIRRCQPDVIHAHANCAAEIISYVKRWTSARCIATCHGQKKRHIGFGRFDQIIAVSDVVAGTLPFQNVSVVFNGIQPPQLPAQRDRSALAARLQMSSDLPIALSVGRLVDEKGFDILIEAWQNVPARLVIVGEGLRRPQLEQQIARSGMSDRIHLAGFRRDVPELLGQADLKVIASRREGFPYTLVEALMCRAVTVSTDIPGANDFIPAPYVVPRLNPAALNTCLRKTLQNLDAARVEFEPAWDRARVELTVQAMAQNTAKVYFPMAKAA